MQTGVKTRQTIKNQILTKHFNSLRLRTVLLTTFRVKFKKEKKSYYFHVHGKYLKQIKMLTLLCCTTILELLMIVFVLKGF